MAVAMEGRNVQLVAWRNGKVCILMPRPEMTPEEAINLAAWLVALADNGHQFRETLCDIMEVRRDA